MDQWKNRVALVTGSTSRLGSQIAKDLACKNVTVAALARRFDRLEEIKNSLPPEYQNNFNSYKCDITKLDDLHKTFNLIEEDLGGIDILINNTAIIKSGFLSTLKHSNLRSIIDATITAIVDCTRLAFKSMKRRAVNGHVILINSMAGNQVFNMGNEVLFPYNFYSASKYAIAAMTEIYRQEFYHLETNIKISNISPGLVETEMNSDEISKYESFLEPKDISDAIMYILGTPPHVQIHELTIRINGELC